MAAMAQKKLMEKVFDKKEDEFTKYLQEKLLKTTVNGSEVAAFSWYKKALGF